MYSLLPVAETSEYNAEGWHGEAVTEGVSPTEGVPMLISYDAYRVFYTVARLGSFTKAAATEGAVF